MAGWGVSAWGTSPFGSGSLSIVSAVAIDTRTVRVILSAPPLAVSPIGIGDALNPETWQIVRNDTGFSFTLLEVEAFDPPYAFDIFTLEDIGSFFVQHTVSSTTLREPSDSLIVTPTSANFQGVSVAINPQAPYATRDLQNVQPKTVAAVGGTLSIGSNGDYKNVQGDELVKKLLFRRLSSSKGAYYHLPNYGLGQEPKDLIPSATLPRLQTEIERQALLEPEVDSVAVSLTLRKEGALIVSLKAKLHPSGNTISMQFPLSGNFVQL